METNRWVKKSGGLRFGAMLTVAMLWLCGAGVAGAAPKPRAKPKVRVDKRVPGGEMRFVDAKGVISACPLKHTAVSAEIVGYTARVQVKQQFSNPLGRKIEAIYAFPLPHDAAVDAMTMTVGTRRIKGDIKPREQAREIYNAAKSQGHVASLLDQERPNIFTQAVANIEPNAAITIEISYVETLPYQDGIFQWVFPTVVGPRYMPGQPIGKTGTGWSPDTTQVPDASKISPPVAPPPTRAGHDLSLSIRLQTGAVLSDVGSSTHPVDIKSEGVGRAFVTLKNENMLPNQDFVLHYRTAGAAIGDAFLTHTDARGTFFTLVLQPPRRVAPRQAVPKEMIFVIDRSGSMEGFPIETAKIAMRACIEGMNPRDTFNLLSFSGGTGRCFSRPMPNTRANRRRALDYLKDLNGSGGTEMMPAVMEALGRKTDRQRLRTVCFMTDGYVGNDFEIVDAVKKHAGTSRVFAFGIGGSVNRFLLSGMAREGRGASEVVDKPSDGKAAAKRFRERIQSPVLTDIQLDWGDLQVEDVYPKQLPDLFSSRPLMIQGRLKNKAGVVTLRGRTAKGRFDRRIAVNVGKDSGQGEALASLWARAKVQDLMASNWSGLQDNSLAPETKEAITQIGVDYHLMTQFTSFVAVEEQRVTKDGESQIVAVPVEIPSGVSYEGVFGSNRLASSQMSARAGDPLISVQAPPDVKQVIALLPGGEIKRLLWNARNGKWEARFDIPTYATEGAYVIRVLLVTRDNHRRTLVLRYRVDNTAPKGLGHASVASSDAKTQDGALQLELVASSDTNRVSAMLSWGEKVELKLVPGSGNIFRARVPLSTHVGAERDQQVIYILTDEAHNRTSVSVDMSR